MKVAVIGAGNVGKALASSMGRAGHEVTLSASTPESARQAAQTVGVAPAESNGSAAALADVVVLAVPYAAAPSVAREIRDEVAGKPVIDVTNPLTPDYSGLATDGISAAEEIQERLPDAAVVKAFNTVFASRQADPGPDVDVFVAGEDPTAKQAVISLAESMGFSSLDVGPLRAARHLEGIAFINIALNVRNGWSWTSTWKLER